MMPNVVGIGASAGGLDAFRAFFGAMPPNTGMAFVVILHLPANRRSLLGEILQRWTTMRVREVEDGDTVEADTVYVPPPHTVTIYRDGKLHVEPPPANGPRDFFRPIDGFFDTLAAGLQERAIGIIMSGTGSDGALGLKAIRACGGLTVAQSFEDKAGEPQHHDGMPASAIATGAVDLVCPVQDIPAHLIRLRGTLLEDQASEGSQEATDALRLRICTLLRMQVGHDFSNYKEKTFLRRVDRRMQVRDIRHMKDYASLLETDPAEALMLFRDLLIRVTSFFRDEAAFKAIERVVVPRLFAGRHADNTVRVWVPGCSTGEEAYSLAILLREHMDGLVAPPRVQIFATDIDEPAIGAARLGRYPAVLLDGLSPARRDRFFARSESGYLVAKEIRDICTFSAHSLVRDPPFSRMDLVSCRNLLIYLDADLQGRVIPSFHYALAPDGILILGSSEGAVRHEELFTPLDKPARIFLRRNVRSPPIQLFRRDVQRLAHPERAAQPGSRPERSVALPRTRQSATRLSKPPALLLRLAAIRAESLLARLLRASLPGAPATPGSADDLSAELSTTREQLQSITEEHETAVEELRSANEELHSVNEELQSTNEELETSKEEIQSVNEELHTVNSQLQDKVEELDRANSDLRNLFDSTQIATVFLDRFMVVRSFTPAIASIYNLIPSDIGRPLTDIVSSLAYPTLREDTRRVLDTRAPLERQVPSADGNTHYFLRILPYRGSDSAVSGTLVTFLDVSSVVRAEKHQRLLVDELNHRVKNMLTVVVSLASQTLRRSETLDEFRDAFLGRVHALSCSYALLSRENWVSVRLRDVVEEEVRPFITNTDRIMLDGGEVQLTPMAALAIGMAVHELATNAVKYGALSQPDGRVRIEWRHTAGEGETAPDAPDKWLVLDWTESGGPAVTPPAHTGFGTLLIERGLRHELGGGATLAYHAAGLHARLCASLDRVVNRPAGVTPA